MVPLGAEIYTERVYGDSRRAVRRTLRLGVNAQSTGEVAMALILNISETGLLLETLVGLEVGETLQVAIPEASSPTVRVIWTEGLLAGCAFVDPVPTGVVSAAQLKGAIGAADEGFPGPASPPAKAGDYDGDEAVFQRVIVMISALISLVALIIFLAAVVPL